MFKKIALLTFVLTFIFTLPAFAATGMEYIYNQSITNEDYTYNSLAMVTKTLSMMGDDTTNLKQKLSDRLIGQDLKSQAFRLWTTSDPDIAASLIAKQSSKGSWNDNISLTALITFVLQEVNLEINTQNAITYLCSHQNEDGGWGESNISTPVDTALALMVLKNSNYNDSAYQKGLQWILHQQSSEGGWSNNINTAWACFALQNIGSAPNELKKGVENLKSTIIKDGGWGISAGEASDPFATALVLQIMQKYDPSLNEVVRGRLYLRKLVENEYWVNKASDYYNITEICHLLWDNPDFALIKANYLNYLKEFPVQQNNDYLARKISIMSKNGEVTTELINQLLAGQNSDGGWGFGQGNSSNPWETVLALRALLDSGHTDITRYQRIAAYFRSSQNNDGSYNTKKGEAGQVYLTAMITEELIRLNSILECTYIINSSYQWLIGRENKTGGYGDGILETARALRVIISNLTGPDMEKVLTFINNSQSINGSWNGDLLTTALILSVLNSGAKKESDIYFSPIITITGSIMADKPEYVQNETAVFDVKIENNRELTWSGSAEVIIKDKHGNTIAVVGRYNSLKLGPISSGNNKWAVKASWNTGLSEPAVYSVELNVSGENNIIIAKYSTPFSIIACKSVSGELKTDKTVYTSNETVELTMQLKNESPNINLENLIGKIEILNSSNQLIWVQEYNISSLPTGQTDTQSFNWAIGNATPGEYQVRAIVYGDGEIVWSGAKFISVSSTLEFLGNLDIIPNEGKVGQTVDLTYTLTNKGNQNCKGLLVRFIFVNLDSNQGIMTFTVSHNLSMSQSLSEVLKYVVDISDAQYLVNMEAEVNGKTFHIDSATLLVDSTPPVSSVELSDQRLQKNGVHYGVLSSELALNAIDDLSGVAEILYDIGSGYQVYSKQIIFPAEGKYTIKYKSKDRLGNEEAEKGIIVVIDQTPPVAVINSPFDGQEVGMDFITSLAAWDNVALDHYELYIDGLKHMDYNGSPVEQNLVLQPGSHILKVRAVDNAEYESWSAPVNILIAIPDITPPVTVPWYPTSWKNTNVMVGLTATDDISGVKETKYRVNGGLWETGIIILVKDEGNHSIEFYSTDKAGNIETIKMITVKIDKTSPHTIVTLTGEKKPDGVYKSDVAISLTATDNINGSGVASIFYRIGTGENYNRYIEPFVITEEGLTELYVYSIDYAGNIEPAQRFEIQIIKGWELDYSLICNNLTVYGTLNVDRIFVNGPVNIYGQCQTNYLGTIQNSILTTGPSVINVLETSQPYRTIPNPDWGALKNATTLRQEAQIPQNVALSNVRFENSLMIAGTTKLNGLIVVKGDLIINGDVHMDDTGIFCSGKITFNGNVKGSGLIFCLGLTAHGNPQLNGAVIVNGPVEASGTIGNNGPNLQKYLKWFN